MERSQHIARRVLMTEAQALEQLASELSTSFDEVIKNLTQIKGRIILTGVGKSGHVARKIAATLASTGTPSLYIHPTEASLGDMGMITPDDAVIALSRSGETRELSDVISFCRRFDVPLLAMTAKAKSALGQAANHLLLLPNAPEACGETRAPTTSTTLQMALGDAVAVALLEARGFTASDFKTFHPGGALGASLLNVGELMHDDIPLVDEKADLTLALKEMSDKGFGCVGITSHSQLIGIITDGDIRRYLSNGSESESRSGKITDIMTKDPQTAKETDLAADALRRMTAKSSKITQLFVVSGNRPVGIVHLHDFLRAGLK